MIARIYSFLPLVSPMIVKELRQEMRMRSFGVLFLVPQLIMALVILIQATSVNSTDVMGAVNWVFWPTLAIPLLILIPRRGVLSFAKEVEAEALELVLLTNMNAWCIVVGKWLALTLLNLLFLFSMSPYIVLRYFVGDKNPISSVGIIATIWVTSLILTALSVSFSSSTRGKRSAGVIVLISIVLFNFVGSFTSPSFWRASALSMSFSDLVVVLFLGGLGILLLLEVGVSHIAPVLEMYALRKRSLALLGIAAGFLFILTGFGTSGLVVTLLTICLVPVTISSMYEALHPVVIRFITSKKSMLAWLIYPGWPGGVLFSVIVVYLFTWLLALSGVSAIDSVFNTGTVMLGAVLTPFAIMRLLFYDRLHNMFMYLFLQCLILVSNLVMRVPVLRDSAIAMLFASLPINALFHRFLYVGAGYSDALAIGFSGAALVILFAQFMRVLRFASQERVGE